VTDVAWYHQVPIIVLGVAILADQVEIVLWEIKCDRMAAKHRRQRC